MVAFSTSAEVQVTKVSYFSDIRLKRYNRTDNTTLNFSKKHPDTEKAPNPRFRLRVPGLRVNPYLLGHTMNPTPVFIRQQWDAGGTIKMSKIFTTFKSQPRSDKFVYYKSANELRFGEMKPEIKQGIIRFLTTVLHRKLLVDSSHSRRNIVYQMVNNWPLCLVVQTRHEENPVYKPHLLAVSES